MSNFGVLSTPLMYWVLVNRMWNTPTRGNGSAYCYPKRGHMETLAINVDMWIRELDKVFVKITPTIRVETTTTKTPRFWLAVFFTLTILPKGNQIGHVLVRHWTKVANSSVRNNSEILLIRWLGLLGQFRAWHMTHKGGWWHNNRRRIYSLSDIEVSNSRQTGCAIRYATDAHELDG